MQNPVLEATKIGSVALALWILATTALTAQGREAPESKANEDKAAQVAHLEMLVANVGHDDPRVRYAIRQALVPLGSPAIAALNGAKGRFKDQRVKQFIARTVKAIKAKRSRTSGRNRGGRSSFGGGRSSRGRGGRFGGSTEVDIDKVAMDANLTWDQMDKVLPIIREVRKESRALWTEIMESEGWAAMRDEAVREDLDAALIDLSKQGESKLQKVLKPDQIKHATRHLNPMADMMRRWNKRMKEREKRRSRENRNRGGERRPR